MGKREFTIWIFEDIDWEIRLKGHSSKKSECFIAAFAMAEINKTNEIVYLFDIGVNDKDLELVKKDKRFDEICIFAHIESPLNEKIIKEFEGTFIDALKYVKEALKDE